MDELLSTQQHSGSVALRAWVRNNLLINCSKEWEFQSHLHPHEQEAI